MTFFNQCEEKYHPKVLGLSATLLNANTTVLQFSDELKILEDTFRSKIITSSRVAEVKKYPGLFTLFFNFDTSLSILNVLKLQIFYKSERKVPTV